MPNNYDFSKLSKVKTIEISDLNGWVSPVKIEYGSNLFNGLLSYFWKVKGTNHTFVISVKQIDFLSKGDYVKHFKTTLEQFRKDYIEWQSKYQFEAEWMHEYNRQFSKFISL